LKFQISDELQTALDARFVHIAGMWNLAWKNAGWQPFAAQDKPALPR
jgi:hypothetical protein